MRTSHTIYNVVGLTITLILLVSACGQIQGHYREGPMLYTVFIALLVGGGSFTNLAGRGLLAWPTIITITGYCLSIFLLPFGIWGIIALVFERKRQHKRSRRFRR